MAFLSINGVSIDCGMKEEAHTLAVHEHALYDDSRTDYLCTEIVVDALGTVHPQALATAAGNSAGRTLRELVDVALGQPRKLLILRVSDDRVIESPIVLPNGQRALSDVRNGPQVEALEVVQIIGDKTVLVRIRVRTWINTRNNVLLSNRWSYSRTDDSLHYGTIEVSGTAVVRGDLARDPANPLSLENLKASLFIPCPLGCIRGPIRTVVREDGLTFDYHFTDAETPLSFVGPRGEKFPGITVKGSMTTGYECDLNSAVDDAKRGMLGDFLGLDVKALGKRFLALPKDLAVSLLPRFQANSSVRVVGDRNAQKADLAQIALQAIVDRFSLQLRGQVADLTLWTKLVLPVSTYMSVDVETRDVELRMEFFPCLNSLPTVFSPSGVVTGGGMLRLTTDVDLGTRGKMQNAPAKNPEFPGGNNTRGTLSTGMIIAALTPPGQPPAPPPAAPLAKDVPIR